jgi:hypothetical protein
VNAAQAERDGAEHARNRPSYRPVRSLMCGLTSPLARAASPKRVAFQRRPTSGSGIKKARRVGCLPRMWTDFAVTVADLAGALVGLLFVAVSIKSDVLAQSRALSSRAAETTLVPFMISAISAVLLVAPRSGLALGAELLTLSAVSATGLFILNRQAGHDPGHGVACYIERASPNAVTAVLVGVAGLKFPEESRRWPVLDDPGCPVEPGRRGDQRVAIPARGVTAARFPRAH